MVVDLARRMMVRARLQPARAEQLVMRAAMVRGFRLAQLGLHFMHILHHKGIGSIYENGLGRELQAQMVMGLARRMVVRARLSPARAVQLVMRAAMGRGFHMR